MKRPLAGNFCDFLQKFNKTPIKIRRQNFPNARANYLQPSSAGFFRAFGKKDARVLFKKKKNKPEGEAVQVIRPVVIRTENVAKELMNVAQSNGVSPAALDFNLLEVQTMKRMGDAEEWEELSGDEVAQLYNDSGILDEQLQIKQVYEIEIFTKTSCDMLDTMQLSIGANGTMCKVYLTIKEGSRATYFDGFEEALKKLINKKKLRAKLLLWVFDQPMQEPLKDLCARVRVNENVTFDKAETFLISESMEPVPTVNDALKMHYEEKKRKAAEGDRVDYSRRGYLVSVVQDELLIEYVKARKGDPGRNCRGEYIVPKEPVVSHEPAFNISDKIERVETDERVEFRAKQSGYVTFENGTYDINSEMDVTEISFKTTGSIETELDADVSINVKETDSMKDAIGMGMAVEVNEINIEGNIGSNSKVRARKANIEGQTHQTSEVYADDLRINIHKGKAVGHDVHITRLEHGTVEGETVTVKQATGGKIRARVINIEILGSHVTMTATEKIEVNQLKGSENRFIIDPVVMHDRLSELSSNEDRIKEAKRQIMDVEKEVQKYATLVTENNASFQDLKKRLLQYKKSGVQMPTSFVKKYKQFQQMQAHLDSLKKELTERNERLELLSRKHHAFQGDIFKAKVICHDQWKGHNEIVYKMIEPEIEVTFVPPEYSTESIFMLHEDEDDGHYYIIPVDA